MRLTKPYFSIFTLACLISASPVLAAEKQAQSSKDYKQWQVRLRAARALGQLGPAHAVPAVPALTRLLTESIANLRKEAVIALGETRHESALPAVRLAAEDPDPEVRKVARLALSQLQSQ